MRTALWLAVGLALGCTVDSENGFPSVMTGASATAPTSVSGTGATGDATTDTEGTAGGSAEDTATSGAATVGTITDGMVTTGSDSGTGDSTGGGMVGPCGGQALDPQLEVPPLCQPACVSIGFSNDCPAGQICRLKDSATSVCENCITCGNSGAACSASNECNILFTCFKGQCALMCDLSTPQVCGNPAACTDVGHPTHGACDPAL